MSVAVARERALSVPPELPAQRPRKRRRILLPLYSAAVLFYLMSPILIIAIYSFNETGPKRVAFRWQGFTLHWYATAFIREGLTAALKNSLLIAAISTVIATVLGTFVALALVRYRFRGKGAGEFVLFANIAAPEIVLGASLLSLFVTFGVPRGIGTIIIAHVMFNIAYVTVTVRARLSGFDRSVEEAAQDLGANPLQTFLRVTLPIIFPGIIAAALLAFALSIDDFIITNFVAGSTETFPLWVYGAVKVGIPPQVFVLGTLIFTGGVILAIGNIVLQRRKA